MAGYAGWDILKLIQEETCEHDRSTKRYDKFGQRLQKLRDQIPKSKSIYRFINK